MHRPIPLNTATLPIPKLISRSPWRRGFLLIPLALALAWFALSPAARPADGDLGAANTAEGDGALASLSTGTANTSIGFDALFSNTTGFGNTANGAFALQGSTTGDFNTATGYEALLRNTTGNFNTASGASALDSNTTGHDNTALNSGLRSSGRFDPLRSNPPPITPQTSMATEISVRAGLRRKPSVRPLMRLGEIDSTRPANF